MLRVFTETNVFPNLKFTIINVNILLMEILSYLIMYLLKHNTLSSVIEIVSF
jgi:hypothetical protein